MDASSAAVARAHCDAVMEGDIEQLLSSGALSNMQPAQCWVFGDTLEHLRDPWQTLRAIRTFLIPEGHVCACIPNMQHWSIQVRLNTGNLDYAESGLLDRTHLRWFTRITMQRLFENSGYSIKRILPRIFEHPHNQAALNLVGQFAAALGNNVDQARQDALPLQYVIKAAPLATSPGAASQR